MSVIQSHGYITGLFFVLLLKVSMQSSRALGMAPGGEFRRAFQEVRQFPGCLVYLGDRPIRITLLRTLRALSIWQALKLSVSLASKETVSAEEVEECKQYDFLDKIMKRMAGDFPAFANVFVKERDQVLCHSLQVAATPRSFPDDPKRILRPVRVVGVVGIAHTNGIVKWWGKMNPEILQELLQMPQEGIRLRATKFLFKYGFLSLFVYGVFRLFRTQIMRVKGQFF